jgi:copper chaperone NosL
MRRHRSIEPAVEKPVHVVPEPGTPSAIIPALVRAAFGVAAAALLLVAARLPIWQAQFSAPQYPKGLNIAAYGGKVEGDLSEINELSHYIGMPPFNFVGMPEMRLWPLVIVLAIVAAVLAVVTRRAWLRRLACAALWLMPVGALADVQFRLWQVGHSLDPTSAIRVSPFTPHVLGPTTMMNFTVVGLPGTALVLIALAAALVTSAPFVVRRLLRSRVAATNPKQTDAELTGTQPSETGLSDSELTDIGLNLP